MLDYKLPTCQERVELVNNLIEQTPSERLTPRYLEILGDYIMGGISNAEKKEHLYITDNRRLTIDRRETSFERLAEKFENGADGIYNLMTNDKNIIFHHKYGITQNDIDTIPGLKELRDSINDAESALQNAQGRQRYLLKKQIIEMRKSQYALKSAYRPTTQATPTRCAPNKIDLTERRYIDSEGNAHSDGLITLFNPQHVSALLCRYGALKNETRDKFNDDFYYLLSDLDKLIVKALKNYPTYLDILKYKVSGKTNREIQQMLLTKYNISHSPQYISELWRGKIPKVIAKCAQDDYIIAEYEINHPELLKKCARCGARKPAIARFYSPNKTARDGWYAWCKECRRKHFN